MAEGCATAAQLLLGKGRGVRRRVMAEGRDSTATTHGVGSDSSWSVCLLPLLVLGLSDSRLMVRELR